MIAAKVAMVDLAVELNLPLSTLVRINKVFKKSLRIQTLLKGQLKMFLFLVLNFSFLCLLFFFSVIRCRHVCFLCLLFSFLSLGVGMSGFSFPRGFPKICIEDIPLPKLFPLFQSYLVIIILTVYYLHFLISIVQRNSVHFSDVW